MPEHEDEHDSASEWRGAGWSVRRGGAGIEVGLDDVLDPAAARELSTALHHAAWTVDAELTEADWTHALLVAALVRAGGSLTLPLDLLGEADGTGGPAGRFYGYEVEVCDVAVRVSVIPAPAGG